MHTAEITWYREDTDHEHEEQFSSVEKCISWLEFMANGRPTCRAWIDGDEVKIYAGKVVIDDGKRIDLELIRPYLGLKVGTRMSLNTILSKLAVAGGIAKYVR